MSKQDPLSKDINKHIKPPSVNSGLTKQGKGAEIKTNWQNIEWTKKKIFLASSVLGFPYTVAVVASFVAGIYLITGVLLSVALLVFLLYQFVKQIEQDEY